jgi:hypothetical protein
MSTEPGDVQFKVKEGLPHPFIVAEPQSIDGALPGGISGMGFTLRTKNLEDAERIAKNLNEEVRQVFIDTKETKCAEM